MPEAVPEAVDIEPVKDRDGLDEFLGLPDRLLACEPAYVPALWLDRRWRLDRRRNAFFDHAEVELFLARRSGETVGRVSGQLDREQERHEGGRSASFGFLLAADAAAVRALLGQVESWATARGASRLRGPFSLSINQESGVLVRGFEHRPRILMPYNRPELGPWIEAAGFRRAKDLLGLTLVLGSVPEPIRRIAERARLGGARVRTLERWRLEAELLRVRDVFNRAWARNWGFVPLTDLEIRAMARDLRLILDPRIALLVEREGQVLGVALTLPDLNEAIAGLGGRLWPSGWLRLLWRLKARGLGAARLALFGLLEGERGARGVAALLAAEVHDRLRAAGYRQLEVSWVLEENRPALGVATAMGATVDRVYRVFEKDLP